MKSIIAIIFLFLSTTSLQANTDKTVFCEKFCGDKYVFQINNDACICHTQESINITEGYLQLINNMCEGRPANPLIERKYKINIKPKFKVGDCISFGAGKYKIYNIRLNFSAKNAEYVVVDDVSCKEKERALCNGSSYPLNINMVDREGAPIECP